jgi:hypothetical protein
MVYHIYCDESRQSQDRFMVIGGLIIDAPEIERFTATMRKFRDEQKMFAELKWTKVTDQKLPQYKRFVDYFFALNNTDVLHFHCIIVDNHQVDHHKFSKGDKELGFYKFYYQLLLHSFGKRYCREGEDDRFIVRLDERNSSYSLGTLKVVLNRGLNKKYKISTEPFVSIEPMNSKASELMQVNDIILGAIGSQKNGYDLLAGGRASKRELGQYIAAAAGLKDLKESTPWGRHRFTIWNFRLQK